MRLIDADALKEHIQVNAKIYAEAQFPLDVIIDNAPTVAESCKELHEVATERPKGKWVRKPNEHRVDIICTNCGYDDGYSCFKFCPNCGATMGGTT